MIIDNCISALNMNHHVEMRVEIIYTEVTYYKSRTEQIYYIIGTRYERRMSSVLYSESVHFYQSRRCRFESQLRLLLFSFGHSI